MTNEELKYFLENEEVKVGDKLMIYYTYDIIPTYLHKELVLPSLVEGNQIISTKYGLLRLEKNEDYLIVYSDMAGLTGITAKYIDKIEFDGYAPLTKEGFYKFIKDFDVKSGDLVSLIMIDNAILNNFKLLENELFIDEDNDTLVLVELPNGTKESMFLNTIGKIQNRNKD
jgi:hypothetical protein